MGHSCARLIIPVRNILTIFFDVRGHRYNLLAAVQKARHWYGESTNEADQGIACEALLGHRIDDRVERVRDLQVVGQVRFVHGQVAEDDRLPRR